MKNQDETCDYCTHKLVTIKCNEGAFCDVCAPSSKTYLVYAIYSVYSDGFGYGRKIVRNAIGMFSANDASEVLQDAWKKWESDTNLIVERSPMTGDMLQTIDRANRQEVRHFTIESIGFSEDRG